MAYDYELRRRMIGFAGFMVLVGGMVFWGTSDLHRVLIGRSGQGAGALEKQAAEEASAIALSSLRMAGTTAARDARAGGEEEGDEPVAAK